MKKILFPIMMICFSFIMFGCSKNKYNGLVYEKRNDEIIVKGLTNSAHKNAVSIEIPEGVIEVGGDVFDGEKLTKVTLPKSLKRINYFSSSFVDINAIYYNGTINDWCGIEMRSSSSLGKRDINKFYYIDNEGDATHNNKTYKLLTELIVPEGIDEVGVLQFSGFDSLKNVTFSSSVKKVDRWAFAECNSLDTTILTSNLELVDDNAFIRCPSLLNIFIQKGRINFGKVVFDDKYHEVYFSGNIKEWLDLSFSYKSFSGNHSLNFSNVDNPKTTDDYSLLTDLVLPSDVTIIGPFQFNELSCLKSVTLPKSLINYGGNAFNGNSGVRYYYNGSLDDWLNIDFEYSASNPICTNNSVIRFLDDSGIIEYNGNHYTGDYSIIIPNNTITIKKYIFAGFEILSPIYIPKSVTKIEKGAFYSCTGLNTIYYEGSEEEWKNIEIEAYNDILENATIIYNS